MQGSGIPRVCAVLPTAGAPRERATRLRRQRPVQANITRIIAQPPLPAAIMRAGLLGQRLRLVIVREVEVQALSIKPRTPAPSTTRADTPQHLALAAYIDLRAPLALQHRVCDSLRPPEALDTHLDIAALRTLPKDAATRLFCIRRRPTCLLPSLQQAAARAHRPSHRTDQVTAAAVEAPREAVD